MKSIILIFTLFLAATALSQRELPTPPINENTHYFSIKPFNRQPLPPPYMRQGFKLIQTKSPLKWEGKDSLIYAYELGLGQNVDKALNYFIRLKTDTILEPFALAIYHFTLRKTDRFQTLINDLNRLVNMDSAQQEVYRARLKLAETRLFKRDLQINISQTIIFPRLKDTSFFDFKKHSPALMQKLVPIARAHEKALRADVLFTDDTDKVLSKAYEELGDFMNHHFYSSNAFIAYSISRHFDRRNSSVARKLKETKNELNQNNLLLPSFISRFPKIKDEVYIFNEIIELDSILLLQEAKSSASLEELLKANTRKDRLPWLDFELIGIAIILFILIIIVFFIKTKD